MSGVLCEDCFERYTQDERTQSERDMGWEGGFHPASPEPEIDFLGPSHPSDDADVQNVSDARNIYEDVIQRKVRNLAVVNFIPTRYSRSHTEKQNIRERKFPRI